MLKLTLESSESNLDVYRLKKRNKESFVCSFDYRKHSFDYYDSSSERHKEKLELKKSEKYQRKINEIILTNVSTVTT